MAKYTVSSRLFKDMILTAASFLEQNKGLLNDLNVFPVPDGDTGTNMSMTMVSAAREVNAADENSVVGVASALAMGALKGARGNSGVILSQIFRGFSQSITKEKPELETEDFANALEAGVACAYKAVMKPKEGTILTVAKGMAEIAKKKAKQTNNMLSFLDEIIAKGNEILQKTPEMLPVLKEAGVVDAGGAGLLVILKGFKMTLDGEEADVQLDFSQPVKKTVIPESEDMDIEFGYCTEFFIKNLEKGVNIETIDRFREHLMNIGDCVLVVGDTELVKVHVHTNVPGKALQLALRLGELSSIKIDNMREQHREILTDMEEKPVPQKEMALVAVSPGEGLSAIFKDFMVDEIVSGGQSMNPSIEDIGKAISKAPSQNVIVLPNNKNVILAAQQAGDLSEKNVVVIPSKSFPQGLSAVLAFNTEDSLEENQKKMTRALGDTKSGQVTYAVRDTVLNGETIREGDILGLFEDKIVAHGSDLGQIALELLEQMADEDDAVISLYYGKNVSAEDAKALKEEAEEQFDELDVEVYSGQQPVYDYIVSVE